MASLPVTAPSSLPLLWKGVLGLVGEVAMSADSPGTPPEKTIVAPPRLVAEVLFRTPAVPRCAPACVDDSSRVQRPLEVTCYLLEEFDGDEGRRFLARRVSEAAPKVVHACMLVYPHRSLDHVFVCADRDSRHPSFVGNTSVDAFQEINVLHRLCVPFRWLCHGPGGVHQDDNIAYLEPEDGDGSNHVGRDIRKAERDNPCTRRLRPLLLRLRMRPTSAHVVTPGRTFAAPRRPPAGYRWSKRSSRSARSPSDTARQFDLVPYHVDTSGGSTGTQLGIPTRAVIFTVL